MMRGGPCPQCWTGSCTCLCCAGVSDAPQAWVGGWTPQTLAASHLARVQSAPAAYRVSSPSPARLLPSRRNPRVMVPLLATELFLMQQLSQGSVDGIDARIDETGLALVLAPAWLTIERLLRQYAQFHFDQPIRSAALIDGCFAVLSSQPLPPPV